MYARERALTGVRLAESRAPLSSKIRGIRAGRGRSALKTKSVTGRGECELRHITPPRIDLLYRRFLPDWTRRQWRVLFGKLRPNLLWFVLW